MPSALSLRLRVLGPVHRCDAMTCRMRAPWRVACGRGIPEAMAVIFERAGARCINFQEDGVSVLFSRQGATCIAAPTLDTVEMNKEAVVGQVQERRPHKSGPQGWNRCRPGDSSGPASVTSECRPEPGVGQLVFGCPA